MRPGGSIRPITASPVDGFSSAGFSDHAQHFALGDVEGKSRPMARKSAAAGDEFHPRDYALRETGSIMKADIR